MNQIAKNKYGQYFTPKAIASFMVDLVAIQADARILEPSCGEGVFLKELQLKGFGNLIAYEIDEGLGKDFDCIRHESFVSAEIGESFDLVIGNPPYIRWKNLEEELKKELSKNELWKRYFNKLCDYLYIFILKSIELLHENGQLIFICPEYWMNTTHSLPLRNYMVENGYFEQIYHFNETPIFSNANVSVVIFKYIKSKRKKASIDIIKCHKSRALTAEILGKLSNPSDEQADIARFTAKQFEKDERWLLIDSAEKAKIELLEKSCRLMVRTKECQPEYATIGEVCEIGNGMVSGLDKAFQLNGQQLTKEEQKHTIPVIKAKDLMPFSYKKTTKYIFANDIKSEDAFAQGFPNFHFKLYSQKERLNKRYNYHKDIKYWQWVFLRNFNLFSLDVPRIFVPCKERISNKDYFRFSFVESGIFPTQDVTAIFPKQETKESIYYILAFLNNHRVFDWLKHKGIVKGNIVEFSEKPLSNIPFRRINWEDKGEVWLYNLIINLTKNYLREKQEVILDELDVLFDKLLSK